MTNEQLMDKGLKAVAVACFLIQRIHGPQDEGDLECLFNQYVDEAKDTGAFSFIESPKRSNP